MVQAVYNHNAPQEENLDTIDTRHGAKIYVLQDNMRYMLLVLFSNRM